MRRNADRYGVSHAGGAPLNSPGMVTIDLKGIPVRKFDGVAPSPADNEVVAESRYHKADGTHGTVRDVRFAYSIFSLQYKKAARGKQGSFYHRRISGLTSEYRFPARGGVTA